MKPEIDLDAIVIDGARLKAAREARGASVADMALAVTLSREQIQHIEDGGDRPFYTPAHKLLAVRKYAAAMDIPYDEIVTGPGADQTLPVPEDAPAVMTAPEAPEPADLRLAAVEHNAEIRRLATLGAVAVCILLAVYAKLRGSQDEARDHEEDSATALVAPAPATIPEPAKPAPVAAADARGATAGDTAGKLDAPKADAPKADAAKAEAPKADATKADIAKTAATQPPEAAAKDDDACSVKASGELKTWSPAYRRKADVRLFMVSPKGGTVCVVDASGKAQLISLRPMAGQAFAGKPPYLVKSSQLPQMEIYLQGLRAKIPGDTDTLRLVPTNQPPPDADAPGETN